jgi:hypothetical protein
LPQWQPSHKPGRIMMSEEPVKQADLTDEQWLLFCAGKRERYAFTTPFYMDGRKIATDGAILLFCQSDPFDNGDRCGKALPEPATIEGIIQQSFVPCTESPAFCPKCDKCNDAFGVWVTGCEDCDSTGKCEECDGMGEVVCRCCDQEGPCQECGGSGKCGECKGQGKSDKPYFETCECYSKSFEWLPGVLVKSRYCRSLQSLGDFKVALPATPASPIPFSIGKYSGIVMPMSHPN